MVRVDQDESVPGLSPLESGNSLVHILHVVLLDPRLDAFLGSELEHVGNGRGRGANRRSREVNVGCDEVEGGHLGDRVGLGGSDKNESASWSDEVDECGERELGVVCSGSALHLSKFSPDKDSLEVQTIRSSDRAWSLQAALASSPVTITLSAPSALMSSIFLSL